MTATQVGKRGTRLGSGCWLDKVTAKASALMCHDLLIVLSKKQQSCVIRSENEENKLRKKSF